MAIFMHVFVAQSIVHAAQNYTFVTIEYLSKCNFNVRVGFFMRVQKIAVRTEQSGFF